MTDVVQNNEPQPTEQLPVQQPKVSPVDQSTSQQLLQPTPQPEPTVQPVQGNYTGETVVETSINIFASSTGIAPENFDDAIENALKYNDINLINTSAFSKLKPEQQAQATALAQAAFKETQARIQSSVQAGIRQAEQLAGGSEQWVQMRNAFNTKAPAHLKAVVEQMLDNHDVENAVKFVIDTAKGLGIVNHGTPIVQGGAGSASANEGITQAQFFAELATLERKAGNNSFEQGIYAQQLQQLQARRNLGRQNGL